MALLERVVVPVASETDALATASALSPHVDGMEHLTVVHVIEKGGGVIDKAPMEKRRADAIEFLSRVESRLGDEVPVETRIEFGTSVAETTIETALETGATAIAFRPRGGNRLVRWLSGDTAVRLVTDSEIPVVSIRTGEITPSSPTPRRRADDTEVGG